ncbi:VOC family protein [Streptomyces pathocidini]|uniref:VOC family protein n=1 Tax=Streptomyces pathocidini TaxID=1650571 RepID=A0ABW7UYU2_9ACTN|nr:VOC family protein [Streptomyces pathocidini]
MQKITTFLWFDDQAEEAVEHYTSVFDDSRVLEVLRWGEEGPGEPGKVLTIRFELAGQQFIALNGGPHFHFTEAVSLYVDCRSQEEVDELWAKLLEGGEESKCGWLKDKYGLSWQIVPRRLTDLLSDPDPATADRVMKAMLGMVKIDLQTIEKAARGNSGPSGA